MRARTLSLMISSGMVVLASAALTGCAPANNPAATTSAAKTAAPQEIGGQDEFGPYEVVANWPQPLPDGPDGVKHEGWTWGSTGAVYAETPDRIWIAMRGELPLPPGAKPWTPYGMLNPTRGNATGNDDGFNATCDPEPKRGWERRYHHVLFVVDRNGKQVEYWPQYDKLFDRGFLGFEDDGSLVISPALPSDKFELLGVNESARLSAVANEHRPFLAYHRDHVFIHVDSQD